MCDLESEPWREHFTGPPCMCGLPTSGNEEERKIEEEHLKAQREARQKQHEFDLSAYKEKRLQEIYNKRPINPEYFGVLVIRECEEHSDSVEFK